MVDKFNYDRLLLNKYAVSACEWIATRLILISCLIGWSGCSVLPKQSALDTRVDAALVHVMADSLARSFMSVWAPNDEPRIEVWPFTVDFVMWSLHGYCTGPNPPGENMDALDYRSDATFTPKRVRKTEKRLGTAEFLILFSDYCANALEAHLVVRKTNSSNGEDVYSLTDWSAGVFSAFLVFQVDSIVTYERDIFSVDYVR